MAPPPAEAEPGAGPAAGRLQKEPRQEELRRLALSRDNRWQENRTACSLAPTQPTPLTSQLPRHNVHHHGGNPGIPVILQQNTMVRLIRGLAVPSGQGGEDLREA